MKTIFSTALLLVFLTFVPSFCSAQDSNRNQVRSNLESNGWRVIWGKNFTEADWLRGSKSIATSIATENPGPFLQWFQRVMVENLNKMAANGARISRQDLERMIVQSLRQKRFITINGMKVEAGFATYNRWKFVSAHVPTGKMERYKIKGPFGTWTYGYRPEMKLVKKKVPLPNWHQFYIRYQIRGGQSSSSSGQAGPGLSSRQYQAKFNAAMRDNLYPSNVRIYRVGNSLRYDASFVRTSRKRFVAKHGMNSKTMRANHNQYTRQGYRLTSHDCVRLGDDEYFIAVWTK